MSDAQEYLNRMWSAREHARANPAPWEERQSDLMCFGIHITRDGQRIDPNDFYMETQGNQ